MHKRCICDGTKGFDASRALVPKLWILAGFVDFALFSRDFKGIRGQALLESATFRSGSVVLFDDSSRWSGSAPAPAMLEAALDSSATLEAAPDSLATPEAAPEDFFSAMTNI